MKSLIWKEARQQLVWFLVALSLATQMWFGMGDVWKQLVLPIGEGFLVFLLWPIVYAFALAQLQFGRDGDERHFGQLVHRGQGARGYFASKVIVGCAAVACVIVLPVTVWALVKSVSDPDASLIQWVRLPQIFLFCVPAFLTYSVGVLSTQLRRGTLLHCGAAICGIPSAFILFTPLLGLVQNTDSSIASLLGAASNVLTAAFVLWLARSLLLASRDIDLPLRVEHLLGLAVAYALLLLPVTGFLVRRAGDRALETIRDAKPVILHDPRTDEFIAAAETDHGWRTLDVRDGRVLTSTDVALNERGRRLFTYDGIAREIAKTTELDFVHQAARGGEATAQQLRSELELVRKARETQAGHRSTSMESVGLVSRSWRELLTLEGDSGAIRILASPESTGAGLMQSPIDCLLTPPGRRFSAEAGFVPLRQDTAYVFDPKDGSLWTVEFGRSRPWLGRQVISGEGRVLGFEPIVSREDAVFGNFMSTGVPEIRTTSGAYRTDKNGVTQAWLPEVAPDLAPYHWIALDEAEKLARYAVHAEWPYAGTELVSVERTLDHQTVFTLTLPPVRASERIAEAGYLGIAFLRAPFAVASEFLFDLTTTAGRATFPLVEKQRLFPNGNHPLLFALVMLFGAFQLFVAWRWMARGGVAIGTRVVYMLLIIVGGVVVLLFTRLLLPRGLKHTRASEAVSWTGDSPRPLHASSPRS